MFRSHLHSNSVRRGTVTASTLSAICLSILVACTSIQPKQPPVEQPGTRAPEASADQKTQWWYLRFRLAREDDGEVNSYLDTLIAEQLLAPIIERYRSDLTLWRFHRRWPKDETGHQFSFIVYTRPDTLRKINDDIEASGVLATLRSDGHLVEYRVDQPDIPRRFDVAGTSDRSWSSDLQKEWPYFIMGVSRLWLGLVQRESARQQDSKMYERYQAVNSALGKLWFNEGNHAFFHHLSGLFGYQPLRVIRRDIMTF